MPNIPIFLSSDNNYAPFVATTIASICDNTKSFCEFYVLDGGISAENQTKICELKKQFSNFEIEFINIDAEKYFKDFKETQYITKSMYSRFLIPDLRPDIKKAIYSDVDVIVLGDIREMYEEDLGDYILGAVRDFKAQDKIFEKHRREIGLDNNHSYFFSGNLLFDCEKWRENDIYHKLTHLANTIPHSKLTCPDQDILNLCFENNYKILDYKYCYCVAQTASNPNGEVFIRHYNGPVKPWHINPHAIVEMMPHLKEFWAYAKKTAFYDALYQKTLDEAQQANVLRKLRVVVITNTVREK